MRLNRSSFFIAFLFAATFSFGQSFKSTQQKAGRVKSAYSEKWPELQTELTKKQVNVNGFEMLIQVFKLEKKVELWLRSKSEKEFKIFKTYDICYYSGELGPKRKQGDGQVPEGFYNIAVFNPYSNYHLSLGINYPNSSDRIFGKSNPGGDIMIHGNCVSIGCIPITDTYIKEVYVLAVEARNAGQSTIPVYIFPSRMDENGMKYLNQHYSGKDELLAFWKNIKTGYDLFEKNKQILKITTDKCGYYVVSDK
jgi:murein L,D-transpeptidase YafK